LARDEAASSTTEASGNKLKTNIPSRVITGLTVTWTKRLADYSPSLWALSYHIRGAEGNVLDVVATDNNDGSFLVSLTASYLGEMDAVTPLAVGQYFFQAYVTNIDDTSDKRLVDSGRIDVEADLSLESVTSFDGRSKAELMLEAIDALLLKKALTPDQMSYTIGQRTLTRIPHDQLLKFRDYYVGIIQAERIKARRDKGLPVFDNILTKYRQPR